MGLIFGKNGWLDKRTKHRALVTLGQYQKMAVEHYRGKDMAELRSEGGWDILSHAWASADDIWTSYTNADLESAAQMSAVVYACMRMICSSAPRAWMEIGKWDGDNWEPVEKHPYLDLLRQPNPMADWRTFLWSMLSHWLLTGFSYIHKVRDPTNPRTIAALYAYPTSWVTAIANDRTGKLVHYEVGGPYADRKLIVKPEDMFAMWQPDPGNPLGGLAPMHAAVRDYQTDNSRASMMIEILSNTHFASAVLQTPENMFWTEPQKEEIRSALRDLIGPGKRGDPLFLAGGTKAEFPQPPSDLDWPGISGLSESRMCSCFGVPPVIIGLRVGLENSPWSNIGEAKTSFYSDTMTPIWDWIASTFERGLFRSEGLDDEVEADYAHIPELQEDKDKLHERARKDWESGGLELDQYLEIIGQEVLGGDAGKTRILPMNFVPFVPGEEGVPPAPPHDDDIDEETPGEPAGPEEPEGDDTEEEE